MAIKIHRPTSAGRRFYTTSSYEEVTKKEPEKSLLAKKNSKAGRNAQGKVTVRHQGGGNRQKYRIIDFKRNKDNIPAKVVGIEYDPNRTAYIALLNYADGEKRYIIAPVGLKDGDVVMSGEDVEIKVGNALPLAKIPVGSLLHNIELQPKKGGQLGRSAGAEIQLMDKGTPIVFDEDKAKKILSQNEIYVDVIICEGDKKAKAWGCDLSYDYVKINGDYRS